MLMNNNTILLLIVGIFVIFFVCRCMGGNESFQQRERRQRRPRPQVDYQDVGFGDDYAMDDGGNGQFQAEFSKAPFFGIFNPICGQLGTLIKDLQKAIGELEAIAGELEGELAGALAETIGGLRGSLRDLEALYASLGC